MKIPKQLQNSVFRFVLLNRWDKWRNIKTNEKVFVTPEDYLKYKNDKEWKPLGKAPIEAEWQTKNNYKFDDPKLISHINKGFNFGVIGGYGNLVILDIDDPKLAEEFEKNLNTFTIKTGSGGRHFYFIVRDGK